MKGIVKAISVENNAVCITGNECFDGEEWFDLASQVKMAYIKKGAACEFNVTDATDEGNRILTFIKCETKDTPKKSFPVRPSASKPDINNEAITRMSALKASSRIFEATGKELEFKRLTEETVAYIEKGFWTEKA